MRLKDRIAIVTGAARGIGLAIAERLAAEGATVVMSDILDDAGQAAATTLGATYLRCDVSKSADVNALVSAVAERFGAIDILVNNAGSSRPQVDLGSDEVWMESMEINFHAGRRITHALVPMMQANKWGRIINLTGQDEPFMVNAANAPNGAVHIWAKALSRKLGRDGITVNSIPPGRIHSEQIDLRIMPTEEARRDWAEREVPVGYIGEPEDLGVLVAFLCSPRARYITGQVIHVDGGTRRFSH